MTEKWREKNKREGVRIEKVKESFVTKGKGRNKGGEQLEVKRGREMSTFTFRTSEVSGGRT